MSCLMRTALETISLEDLEDLEKRYGVRPLLYNLLRTRGSSVDCADDGVAMFPHRDALIAEARLGVLLDFGSLLRYVQVTV